MPMMAALKDPAELRSGTAIRATSSAPAVNKAIAKARRNGSLMFSSPRSMLETLSMGDGRTPGDPRHELLRFRAHAVGQMGVPDRFKIDGHVLERALDRGGGHQTGNADI